MARHSTTSYSYISYPCSIIYECRYYYKYDLPAFPVHVDRASLLLAQVYQGHYCTHALYSM